LAAAARVWLRIGLLGFGGPAGQIALMHGELVEQRHWIEEAQFLNALNYCMMIPGPEAQQLATYVGWLMHGMRGAVVAGGLFVLPGALVILGLAALYTSFHQLPVLAALFFGLKAAVLAVVLEALLRIGRRTLNHQRGLAALALLSFFATAFTGVPFLLVVLFSGMVGTALLRGTTSAAPSPSPSTRPGAEPAARPARAPAPLPLPFTHLTRVLAGAVLAWGLPYALLRMVFDARSVFVLQAQFFTKVAMLTFGGAYAVLAFVAQQAVDVYGWLLPGEMLDGLGLAETTPGPLILVLQFVGYVGAHRVSGGSGLAGSSALAGCLGAGVTLWATFVPAFFWIIAGAPWVEAIRHKRALAGALTGISAAVVGVIASLATWFAIHVLFQRTHEHRAHGLHASVPVLATFDLRAAALALLAVWLLFRVKWGLPRTLSACALGGLAFSFVR